MKRFVVATWPAAALLALSAGTAFAQNPQYPSENDSGFYIGGGVGQFNIEIDGIDGLDEAFDSLDDNDTSWQAFVGYRFLPWLAVEAAYIDFGRPGDEVSSGGTSGDYNVQLSGFAPSVVATYPLGPVELFGRIGYYFYDLDVRTDLDDLGGNVFSSSDSGEDLMYGGGVGMTFFQHLNARLEYQKIDIKGTDDSNAFWLTGAWRF